MEWLLYWARMGGRNVLYITDCGVLSAKRLLSRQATRWERDTIWHLSDSFSVWIVRIGSLMDGIKCAQERVFRVDTH
jgi:hypothetical protein